MKMHSENFFFNLLQENIPQENTDEPEEKPMSTGEFIAMLLTTMIILCAAVAMYRSW
jgi:hypothetical protein